MIYIFKYTQIACIPNLHLACTKGSTPLCIETTWHNVTCWSGVKSIDLDSLERGKAVELEGRIKNSRYTGSDGVDRTSTEIIVRDIKILESIPKTESGV